MCRFLKTYNLLRERQRKDNYATYYGKKLRIERFQFRKRMFQKPFVHKLSMV